MITHFAAIQGTDAIEEGDGETEEDNTAKRDSWHDHVLRPGLDPEKVPFFILGTHKHDKKCLPHVLVCSMLWTRNDSQCSDRW
jgi:hypothetical protein